MRKIFVVWMVMVMSVVFSANFSFAGDATADGDNGIAIGMDNTNNNTNTANSNSTSSSNATGGNATATGGNSILKFDYTNQREFINGSGIGGYHTDLIGGPNTRGHHRTAQTMFNMRMRMNQVSFNNMTKLLDEFHKMDSSTRTWEDMREDLVVQPRFDFPKTALNDSDFVVVVGSANVNFENISDDDIVGFVTVRDKKPRENSVDKMYMVEAVYPYAKIGGANLLIRIDDFFWAKVKSGSWGAGIGGIFSGIINCFTGGAGSVNGGYSSGSSMEYVAGGELYLAVRMTEKPCPPPPAPPEVKQPCPPQEPPCDLTKIWERIHELEREVQKCTRYCFNNLKLRYALEKEYIELYVCTKETRYLDSAIYNAEVAERNYRKGYDIAAHRAEADQVISEVWYLQAGAINLTRGGDVADRFAASKKLERYPKNFAR